MKDVKACYLVGAMVAEMVECWDIVKVVESDDETVGHSVELKVNLWVEN